MLHQEKTEELLLNEAAARNNIFNQAIEQCSSSYKKILELQETSLRQSINAELLDPFTLFYHLLEANALLGVWLQDQQQCALQSMICAAWLAKHQYINGKLYTSYIKLLLTKLENFELRLRGESELQAYEKVNAHKPQPSSRADHTDQEEDFTNTRPSHHISLAFNAIFSPCLKVALAASLNQRFTLTPTFQFYHGFE